MKRPPSSKDGEKKLPRGAVLYRGKVIQPMVDPDSPRFRKRKRAFRETLSDPGAIRDQEV